MARARAADVAAAKERFLTLVGETMLDHPEWLSDLLARAAGAAAGGYRAQLADARQGLWAALALVDQKRLTTDMKYRLNQMARAATLGKDDDG